METFANVALDNVSKTFGPSRHRSVVALDDLSLSFESGGPAVGIVGESGSGKSTLARILAGLERPSSGTVSFNGVDLSGVLRGRSCRLAFRRAVQFVGQDTTSSFDPRRTLREAVRLPLMLLNGLDREAADRRVDEMLTLMGLSLDYADRRPHQVSGGQRQRFAIARGLVVGPRLLICDEVVSALDVSVQGSILNMLKRYCAESEAGLVFVSHGLAATAFISDELVVMYRGKVVNQGKTEGILHGEDVHPYTAMLLEAHRGTRVDAA
jgi:peptide/nickel transport system ATP-binding protein